jgi:hypothetical protein
MNIPKLKIDKKLYHHYIFSVKAKTAKSDNPGELYLKHGPVYFTNDDIKNLQSSIILSQDRLFKTDQQQALKNFNCTEIVSSLGAMRIAATANDCTMHHFSSEFKVDPEYFVSLVKNANVFEHEKELLKNARIL